MIAKKTEMDSGAHSVRAQESVLGWQKANAYPLHNPLAARLDLAAGDEFHWSTPACQLTSDAIVTKTLESQNIK